MPKNNVCDPITDQEMAFAHSILSGTMTDRQAAEAVGLNPATAAYIKAKPHVRDYMIEHRAAVSAKLVDQEAEGLRNLNLGRDQILARLWALANLNPEATRGSIAGQVKAMAMIVAIEGLIPGQSSNRRPFPVANPPAASPVEKAQPKASQAPEPRAVPEPNPPFPLPEQSRTAMANPFVNPEKVSRGPGAGAFDLRFDAPGVESLPFFPIRGLSAGHL